MVVAAGDAAARTSDHAAELALAIASVLACALASALGLVLA